MYGDLEIRCPKLGGEVTFSYCEKEGGDLPCTRILACWTVHIPIEAYLKERLTPAEWDRCFCQPTKDKMTSLMELIEAAKKQKSQSE